MDIAVARSADIEPEALEPFESGKPEVPTLAFGEGQGAWRNRPGYSGLDCAQVDFAALESARAASVDVDDFSWGFAGPRIRLLISSSVGNIAAGEGIGMMVPCGYALSGRTVST
ncbi:hypothetical protein MesoLj131b_30100 [Mesorhizobium sp. 131-2-5]|nr:hypothetical protein MesoLj131b_30100 [Mesorhizobium sp. 131-2-5]